MTRQCLVISGVISSLCALLSASILKTQTVILGIANLSRRKREKPDQTSIVNSYTTVMAIFGLWVRSYTISLFHSDNIPQVINKAGGLVYQRTFSGMLYRPSFKQSLTSPDGLAQLTSNEYLVLAGTLHGIHAITSRLSPIPGQSSGAQVIEGETFKMNVLLTLTGISFVIFIFLYLSIRRNQIHSLDISC